MGPRFRGDDAETVGKVGVHPQIQSSVIHAAVPSFPIASLLKPRADFYAQAKPTPADVLLIVEVADSSIEFDRNVKVPLYARALILLVWLVDLNAGAIEVYSQPANGAYQQVQVMHRGDRLTIDFLPGLVVLADDLLG